MCAPKTSEVSGMMLQLKVLNDFVILEIKNTYHWSVVQFCFFQGAGCCFVVTQLRSSNAEGKKHYKAKRATSYNLVLQIKTWFRCSLTSGCREHVAVTYCICFTAKKSGTGKLMQLKHANANLALKHQNHPKPSSKGLPFLPEHPDHSGWPTLALQVWYGWKGSWSCETCLFLETVALRHMVLQWRTCLILLQVGLY